MNQIQKFSFHWKISPQITFLSEIWMIAAWPTIDFSIKILRKRKRNHYDFEQCIRPSKNQNRKKWSKSFRSPNFEPLFEVYEDKWLWFFMNSFTTSIFILASTEAALPQSFKENGLYFLIIFDNLKSQID